MKKNLKLFAWTLLSTTTITIPLTILVGSCAANTYNSDSNIVINSQSPTNISINSTSNPPTLSIEASSKNGELNYTWFVSKDEGKTWQTIEGAYQNTYTISDPELTTINTNSIWQYRVEIKINNNEHSSIMSSIYKVNIVPATLKSIDLSQDLLSEISLTSDEDLSLSIAANSKTNKTLKYQWYLQKDDGNYYKVQNSTSSSYKIDKSQYQNIKQLKSWKSYVEIYNEDDESTILTSNICTIQINPKVKVHQSVLDLGEWPSNPIEARPSDANNGITTVKYESEKWLGDNSVSILLKSEPNINYIKTYVKSYLEKFKDDYESSNITDKFAYTMMQYFQTNLNEDKCTVSRFNSGTAWLLDYSIDDDNSNLVNYYLATNIHVLDATYTIRYTAYVNTIPFNVSVDIPIRSDTVNSANIYIAQPLYNETNANNNMQIIANSNNRVDKYWYKTSITKDNYPTNIIPLGSFTNNGSPSLADPYDSQLSYTINFDYNNIKYNYYFPKDKSRAVAAKSYSTKRASDFAVIKLSEQKDFFVKNKPTLTEGDNKIEYQKMFNKVEKMFNIDTNIEEVSSSSSYISKMNAILSMLTSENSYDSTKAKNLFMFADYNKDLKNKTNISIGGFPAIWKGNNDEAFVTFNSNTISYCFNKKYTGNTSRPFIEYYYNGNRYVSKYNWDVNDLFKGIMLMGGSSGSMAITEEYKITGIYWGGIHMLAYFDGAMTKIYSRSDASSMISVWLKYVEKNDKNSKLLKLFNGLENKNFFNN